MSATVLWVIAVIIAIVGIVQLIQGQILFGIVLLVVACLVGPGGYSIFSRLVHARSYLGGRGRTGHSEVTEAARAREAARRHCSRTSSITGIRRVVSFLYSPKLGKRVI